MTAKTVRPTAGRKSPLDHDPEALQWAMKAKGWTQDELARAVQISPGYLSMIVNGKRNATPRLLIELADVLNCPVSVLERKRDAA